MSSAIYSFLASHERYRPIKCMPKLVGLDRIGLDRTGQDWTGLDRISSLDGTPLVNIYFIHHYMHISISYAIIASCPSAVNSLLSSLHLPSHHLTSHHLTSPHLPSLHLTSHHITSLHFTSLHFTWRRSPPWWAACGSGTPPLAATRHPHRTYNEGT